MFPHSLNKYLLRFYYELVLTICSISYVRCLHLAQINIENNILYIQFCSRDFCYTF